MALLLRGRGGGGEALAINKIKNFFWDDYFNLLKNFRQPFSSWEEKRTFFGDFRYAYFILVHFSKLSEENKIYVYIMHHISVFIPLTIVYFSNILFYTFFMVFYGEIF